MRKNNAFTLIELLVVISILVLLMAILLPVLQRVRKQARAVACQANLNQWGATLALYAEDSQGRFPSDMQGHSGVWLLRGVFLSGDNPNANGSALHHFGTRGIACCPMAVKPSPYSGSFTGSHTVFGSAAGGRLEGTPGSTFVAWEIKTPAPPFHSSYGYNSYLFRGFRERPRMMRGRLLELDISTLRGRAQIPTMFDAGFMWITPRASDQPPRWEFSAGRGPQMGGVCMNRHNGHVNGLFLDWSVRKIGLKELWTLKWHLQFNMAGPWTKAGGVQPEDWPDWMRKFKDY